MEMNPVKYTLLGEEDSKLVQVQQWPAEGMEPGVGEPTPGTPTCLQDVG